MESSSPFGRILRDHNHRRDQRRRESSNVSKSLNLQELVRNRISIDSGSGADENWSPQHHRIDNNENYDHGLRLTKSKHARAEEAEKVEEGEESTTTVMSPRQSRILDRWVTRQARDMNTTMERKRNEAELLALSGSQSVSARTSTFMRETSPCSETSSSSAAAEIPNLRASSLVRRWRDFEAFARLNHSHSFKSDPGKPAHPNIEKEEEQQPRPSSTTEDDPFTDWESDRAASPPGAAAATGGGGGDSERMKVADIIRRLTAVDQARGSSCCWWSCLSDDTVTEEHEGGSERSSFSLATSNSPRVRGRQAFNDLLMMIERDRQGELDRLAELRPVSRFTQRGRIQSMLRLRFLHRGMESQEHSATLRSPGSRDRLRQRSIIRLLREKFSIGVGAPPAGKTDLRGRSLHAGEFPMHRKLDLEESVPSYLLSLGEDVHRVEIGNTLELEPQLNITSIQPPVTCAQAEEDTYEEAAAGPTTDDAATWQGETSSNISSIRECPNYLSVWGESLIAQEEHQNIRSNDGRHIMEVSDYNWLSDISCPREYWEDLRQERYREILNTSKNEDIRRLLERKRVSSFLTSDLRDQMDQLLGSFLQRRTRSEGGKEREADEERKAEDKKGRGVEVEELQIEEEMSGRYFDKGLDQSTMGGQYYDVTNYFGQQSPSQRPLPSLMGQPWNTYHSNEVDKSSSYQMVLASPHPPHLYQFYSRDNVQNHCSSQHHPSIEMELMYDLRRHIQKLHYEMSELQNSLKTCMEMQADLQCCMKGSGIRESNHQQAIQYQRMMTPVFVTKHK